MNMGSGGGYFSDPITLAYGKMNPLIAVRNKLGEWNFENTQYNPVAQRSKDGDRSEAKTYRAILSPYVTIRFSPAWSFTGRLGFIFDKRIRLLVFPAATRQGYAGYGRTGNHYTYAA